MQGQFRYKGFLISKINNFFEIRRSNNQILASNVRDADTCRFLIDLDCIGEDYKNKLETLNEKEFYEISCIYISLMQKDSVQSLTKDEEILYYWAEKFRNQKMKEKRG